MNDLRNHDLMSMEPKEDMVRHLMHRLRSDFSESSPHIRVDVKETENSFIIKADLPGMRKEDIDVRIQGRQLTIGADIRQEELKEGRSLRSERHSGPNSRIIALTCDVDDSHAKAKYQDGVLELVFPKKVTSSSRRLPIN